MNLFWPADPHLFLPPWCSNSVGFSFKRILMYGAKVKQIIRKLAFVRNIFLCHKKSKPFYESVLAVFEILRSIGGSQLMCFFSIGYNGLRLCEGGKTEAQMFSLVQSPTFATPLLAAVLFLIVILFIFHLMDKLCQQK